MPNYRVIEYVGTDEWFDRCCASESNQVRGEVTFGSGNGPGQKLIEHVHRGVTLVALTPDDIRKLEHVYNVATNDADVPWLREFLDRIAEVPR